MSKQNVFESNLKRIGLVHINDKSIYSINSDMYKPYIKILYLPKGYKLTIDFTVYETQQPSVFFVAPNQFLKIEKYGAKPGHFIFYNRDFYCIQLHDSEVACDGLLFNNINNMPMVTVPKQEVDFLNYLFGQIEYEFSLVDTSLEEMIRTYLKQLLIRSVRLWKGQHLEKALVEQNNSLDFFRKFVRKKPVISLFIYICRPHGSPHYIQVII